jgi:PAS domain S-box-containing protein
VTVQNWVERMDNASGGESPQSVRDDRFRVLVESVKDYAIFVLDPQGRVETWNAGAELIKGYRPDEIVGKSIEVFYTPEDRSRRYPSQLLALARAQGRVEDVGWRVRKDGSRFWADVVITALRNPAGELIGYGKVTRDLTERQKAEDQRRRRDDELLKSEERFRLLVEGVEDYAIFMLDPLGHVATWNSGAERIKGYAAKEIIGRHFSLFRVEAERQAGRCEQELETATRVGRFEEEGWRLRKDGSLFWANMVLTAIRNPAGELVGFAKVTRDLTDRRRLEEERLQRAHAEEAVRLRDQFLSIASHELRTPLTAVQIDLQGLQERLGEGDDRTAKRLGRAVRNADRLVALVDSLMDVTRIAVGKVALKTSSMDLAETTAQVVDSFRESAAKAGCALSFVTAGQISGRWDRLRLEQVILNLLSNAFKYAAGTPVTLAVSVQAGDAVLEVADRGPGVPEADLARIFGRFERAASPRHYGGLGLGLYLSREIVEAHGGTIEARNPPGGGACFTIRLPLEPRPSTTALTG